MHADDSAFGYRLIYDELELTHGHAVGRNRVHRLCKQERLYSTIVKRRGRGRTPGPVVHDDMAQRQFSADDIDRLWYVDISEHPTFEGKLYVCAIKDAVSMRIMSLSMVHA